MLSSTLNQEGLISKIFVDALVVLVLSGLEFLFEEAKGVPVEGVFILAKTLSLPLIAIHF